jgi:hypothetical protein
VWYHVWLGWTVEAFLNPQPSVFVRQSPCARSDINKDLLVLNIKHAYIFMTVFTLVATSFVILTKYMHMNVEA